MPLITISLFKLKITKLNPCVHAFYAVKNKYLTIIFCLCPFPHNCFFAIEKQPLFVVFSCSFFDCQTMLIWSSRKRKKIRIRSRGVFVVILRQEKRYANRTKNDKIESRPTKNAWFAFKHMKKMGCNSMRPKWAIKKAFYLHVRITFQHR